MFDSLGGKQNAAAVGFVLVAAAESFNIFSAMNSSPWTAENFGADEQKAKSCKEYVMWSVVANEALGLGASALARSLWPLIGTTIVTLFMVWIYWRALARGMNAGSTNWQNNNTSTPGYPGSTYNA